MATLGQLVSNSLWFAFDALDHQKTGVVPKSQLKVRQLREASGGVAPLTCSTGVGEVGRCGPAWRVAHCLRDLLTLAPLVSYSLDLRGLPLPRAEYRGGGLESLLYCILWFIFFVSLWKSFVSGPYMRAGRTEVLVEEVGVSISSEQVSNHRLLSYVPTRCGLCQCS